MDRADLQAVATVLTTLAFIAIVFWAYSGRNKERFDEAARLPFADEATETKHDKDSA